MHDFSFQLVGNRGVARAGSFVTPHGEVETPMFMPVGTQASVKALDAADVEQTEAQILLANTYHLWLRPGMEVLQKAGGIHQFMQWDKPILTDSGGFQVWSLGQGGEGSLVKIDDDGVSFRSHLDGSARYLSPEKSIEIQSQIGADIIMCFDEAMPDALPLDSAKVSLTRTNAWAARCVTQWESQQRQSKYGSYQALFGIIQGALHKELREEAARFITDLPVDGIALGGETIGYNMAGTVEVMSWIESILPKEKPRYAMGLGRDPQDIIDAVLAGFDMFDCVGPTRLARNGAVYEGRVELVDGKPTWVSSFDHGRLSIPRAEYKLDQSVINPSCNCYTCTSGYTRSYLQHLYKAKELSYYRLASVHNVWTMVSLTKQLRSWILTGTLSLES
jgi:queuine tRNA-ribosyltransferase